MVYDHYRHTFYLREPTQVEACPSGHGQVKIFAYKSTEPEQFDLYPEYPGLIVEHNPGELVGWDLTCGCFLSGKNFELIHLPDQLPYFSRRENQ